jgi:hypothetical protein
VVVPARRGVAAWTLSERESSFPFRLRPPRSGYVVRSYPDGSLAVAWSRRGTFWLRPAPRRVEYRLPVGHGDDRFADMVVGPVASFLLVLDGRDPLHGSAVDVGGEAVAFLGEPGAGKSTAAARLLLEGHGLLADDLLCVERRRGRWTAWPGHPEIRLWPASGRALLSGRYAGLPRIVSGCAKRRLDPRLRKAGFSAKPLPLRALYVLDPAPAAARAEVSDLKGKRAFFALFKNLYNRAVPDDAVYARQLSRMAELARDVPVRRLRLPRGRRPAAELARLIGAEAA